MNGLSGIIRHGSNRGFLWARLRGAGLLIRSVLPLSCYGSIDGYSVAEAKARRPCSTASTERYHPRDSVYARSAES